MRNGPPSEQYIGEFITHMRSVFRAYHAEVNDVEDVIFRAHQVKLPPILDKNTSPYIVKTAIAEDIIRRILSILTVGRPSVNIITADDKPTVRDNAKYIQEWDNGFLRQIEKQTQQRLFYHGVNNAVAYGLNAYWPEYLPQSWDKYWRATLEGPVDMFDRKQGLKRKESAREFDNRKFELKMKSPLPWGIQCLDPRYIMWNGDSMGVREAVIGWRRSKLELGSRYGIDKNGNLAPLLRPGAVEGELIAIEPGSLGIGLPQNSSSENFGGAWGLTDFWVYMSRDWLIYYSDGKILKRVKNKYYRVPIFLGRGMSTSSILPEKAYRSVISPIKSLIVGLDTMLTWKMHWAGYGVFPMGKRTRNAEAGGTLFDASPEDIERADQEPKADDRIQWSPGGYLDLEPGEDFNWLEAPDVSRALSAMIDIYLKQIEQYGQLPPVVRGYAQGSDQPGYAINQLLQAARTVYEPALDDITTSIEDMLEFIHWTIKELVGEKVYVQAIDPLDPDRKKSKYLGLGPEHISGPFGLQVNIKATNPVRDAAIIQAGQGLYNDGHLSRYTLLSDYVGLENPEREIYRRELEDLLASDEVKQLKTQRLLMKMQAKGLGGDQGGGQGGGAMPPMPGGGQNPLTGAGMPGGGANVGPALSEQPRTAGATNAGGVSQIPNTANQPGGLPVNV